MVGDAAAIAGQPIQEVGLHFGRLFNAITSGTTAGESVSRLQELGLMTGKVKLQFEALAAAQKRGEKPILTQTQAMTLLQGVFAKTEGAMERLSATTSGKLSNLQDNLDSLKVSFGTGFNDGLKSALDATNSFLPQLEGKFAEMGAFFGKAIQDAMAEDYALFEKIGVVIGEAALAGFLTVAEQIGPRMIERFGDSMSIPVLPGSQIATAIGKRVTASKAAPLAEDWKSNSEPLKAAMEDLLQTYSDKGGRSDAIEISKRTLTANEKLVVLYQNAERRREQRKLTSR
jgi:hypothetical protein